MAPKGDKVNLIGDILLTNIIPCSIKAVIQFKLLAIFSKVGMKPFAPL